VQWCIRRDRLARLRFAPLQGDTARALLGEIREDSIVVYTPSPPRALLRSDAILEICRTLGGVWGLLAVAGRLVPRFVRDGVYRYIAKRRKRWMPEACAMPSEATARRFLP
jgi:predicted DCC family thiol-disulfide oxidoreductase YuxK